jgi:hypothetical protein
MYSSIAELRATLKTITTAMMDDAKVTVQIENADDELKTDLSGIIDFSLVPAASTDTNFPIFINLLSKWKTCELCLVYVYSAKRETTQVDDVTYWKNKYDELIKKIRDGLVTLALPDGTVISGVSSMTYTNPKSGVKPYFGTGPYGEFQSDADKKDDGERQG